MKITKKDYKILSNLLDEGIKKIGITKILEHKAKKLGKDIDKRFRWDLLWLSKAKIVDINIEEVKPDHAENKYYINLYSYLNDEHIDTALKYYVINSNILKNNIN